MVNFEKVSFDSRTSSEKSEDKELPPTAVEINDRDTGIPIRIIYSQHVLANTLEELGDARAIAFELTGDIYGPENKDTVWGFAELLGAKRQSKEIGSKMMELHRPMFLVDMMLPERVPKDEEFKNSLHILEGLGVTATSMVTARTLENIFRKQLSRRTFLKNSLAATASSVAIGGLAPLARSMLSDPFSKVDEGSANRKIQRAYDTATEYMGLDANKLTVMFRNLLMAYKIKQVASILKAQNVQTGRHIAFPVGSAHFGIERALAADTKKLENEIRKLIRVYDFPPQAVKSLADIPETYFDEEKNTWPIRHHVIQELKDLL